MSGWGSEGWGNGAWGGFAGPTTMTLISALAIAENVIQLQFSDPVYISNLLDTPDASNPARFSIAVVNGTQGLDGADVRLVSVVSAAEAVSAAEGGDLPPGATLGTFLDLTLDRAMTPFPAQYIISANGLFSADFSKALDPGNAAEQLYGVYAQILQPSIDLPTPTRDFSNPQSLSGAASLPNPAAPFSLGTFGADGTDYVIDQGLQSYKKRIIRRLITKPGGFVHLGSTYGVGILQQAKMLSTAQVQQRISSQAEKQIALEPETDKVTAQLVATSNGLTRLTIFAQPKGSKPFKLTANLPNQT